MSLQAPRTTMFVILARDAPVAAILRRGPSKQVQLIAWSLRNDTFEEGQWFKGRVYERRCDLSPDGTRLLYFASKQRPPYYCWTAVSKVPYFTAMAMWPKTDTYGGGGLFDAASTLSLNHYEDPSELADGFELPASVDVRRLDPLEMGEDAIYHRRLERDGWTVYEHGAERENPFGSEIWIEFDPPIELRKRSEIKRRGDNRQYDLVMRTVGVNERNGPWYVVEYQVLDHKGAPAADLGRLDWADWDPNGDLLFARGGVLYRSKPESRPKQPWDTSNAAEIADFRSNRFAPLPPPERAHRW